MKQRDGSIARGCHAGVTSVNDGVNDALLDQWRGWGKEIWGQIRWLCFQRETYQLVLRIIESNRNIPKNDRFCFWMFANYGHSTAMAIRRALDSSDDVVSLGRLVTDILKHPCAITHARVKAYQAGPRWSPEKVFKKYAAECGEHLDPERLRSAFEAVRSGAQLVIKFANKVVAHPTKRRPKVPYRELNGPVNDIVALYQDVALLLGETGDLYLDKLDIPDESDPAFIHAWIETGSDERSP